MFPYLWPGRLARACRSTAEIPARRDATVHDLFRGFTNDISRTTVAAAIVAAQLLTGRGSETAARCGYKRP